MPWYETIIELTDFSHPALSAAKALLARGTQLIAVALDTPACLKEIPDTAWKVLAWQYDEFVLPCLAEFLQMKKK